MSDSTLTPYTASDGDNLAIRDWSLQPGRALRGVVVLVHGLGEHSGRYDVLAQRLNSWGFAVRGYDQYGHGESGGVRGALPSAGRLIDDLTEVVESTRKRIQPGEPLIVLGHSLGGLVAAAAVAQDVITVEALVLSSPAFDAGLNPLQKFLVATLPGVVPNLTLGNGLDPQFLSHDADVVALYRADPLVHDRISARLARFIADTCPQVLAHAPLWSVPTLLMYAGADRLVRPRGSRAFADGAPARVVTSRCFEDLYHEIFNEVDARPVYDQLRKWLDERF
jgi:alpha-beta hydrolase superfamily lysophospholipase